MVIWIVSCRDKGDEESAVNAFISEESAVKCYNYFSRYYDFVHLDRCPLYNDFQAELYFNKGGTNE